jgi:hypothetical protein
MWAASSSSFLDCPIGVTVKLLLQFTNNYPKKTIPLRKFAQSDHSARLKLAGIFPVEKRRFMKYIPGAWPRSRASGFPRREFFRRRRRPSCGRGGVGTLPGVDFTKLFLPKLTDKTLTVLKLFSYVLLAFYNIFVSLNTQMRSSTGQIHIFCLLLFCI